MNIIEKNLYNFYRIFASAKKTAHRSGTDFEMVYSENNSWPQMIFNLNQDIEPGKLLPLIKSAMKNNLYPNYFIVPQEYISRSHTELLKANAILPVKILTGMDIIPAKKQKLVLPLGCEIRDLIYESEFIDYAQLVREEFMSSDMSFENDILTAIKDSKEIQMVALFCQKKLVSALLVLTSESIAGLYFIVTKKEYQKRGFATILINFILNRMLENHVKKVVLHANYYSFGLYRKLGFVSQNKFVIYKNNEHEHRRNTGKITSGV